MTFRRFTASVLLASVFSGVPAFAQEKQAAKPQDASVFHKLDFSKVSYNPRMDVNGDRRITVEDFVSPDITKYVNTPADLLNDKKISRQAGFPVFILTNNFAREVYGTKQNPNTHLRDLAWSGSDDKALADAFRTALIRRYPEQLRTIASLSDGALSDQAHNSFNVLRWQEGAGSGSYIALSQGLEDKSGKNIACAATVPEAAEIRNSVENFPQWPDARFHEIAGEEVQHCLQVPRKVEGLKTLFGVKTDIEPRVRQFREIDGKLGGVAVAAKLIASPADREAYRAYSLGRNQAVNFENLFRQLEQGVSDDRNDMRAYAYDLSFESLGRDKTVFMPAELNGGRLKMAHAMMELFGLQDEAQKDAFRNFALHRHSGKLAGLAAYLADDPSQSPDVREMARSEAAAYRAAKIMPVPYGDTMREWKAYCPRPAKAPAPNVS